MAKAKKKAAPSSVASTSVKNPLSQALGIVLRKNRLALYPDPDYIANTLSVQQSYYRAVEAGTYHLHISNALKLYDAFGEKFSYVAIQKLLATISIIEGSTSKSDPSYFIRVSEVFKKISEHDDKMQFIFQKFEQYIFTLTLSNLEPEAINRKIIEMQIDLAVEDFLTNYKNINVDHKQKQEHVILNALENVSTLYYDNIENYLYSIEELPTRVRFSDLWKWENKNTPDFTELYGIFQTYNPITCYENLKRYTYPYLWSNNFTRLSFVFLNEGTSAADIKKVFVSNLKKSLKESKKNEQLSRFAEIEKKIHFYVIESSTDTSEILEGEDLDNTIFDENAKLIYDAFWVFERKKKHPVSFLAIKSKHRSIPNYEYFVEGSSLNLQDTLKKKTQLKNLIN